MVNIVNAQGEGTTSLSGKMMGNLCGIDVPAVQRPGGAGCKSGVKRCHYRQIPGCFACLRPIALQHFRQYNQHEDRVQRFKSLDNLAVYQRGDLWNFVNLVA